MQRFIKVKFDLFILLIARPLAPAVAQPYSGAQRFRGN